MLQSTRAAIKPARRTGAPAIYYVHHRLAGGPDGLKCVLDGAAGLGFDHILLSPPFMPGAEGDIFYPVDHDQAQLGPGAPEPTTVAIEKVARACRERGLRLLIDLDLHRFDAQHPLISQRPEVFALRGAAGGDEPVDPRQPRTPSGAALARLREPGAAEAVIHFIQPRLKRWIEAGLEGFRLLSPGQAPPQTWASLIAPLREAKGDILVIADTPRMSRESAQALAGCGFDYLISSAAWWDARARWLAEEAEDLAPVAPLIAEPEAPFGERLPTRAGEPDRQAAYRRALDTAAATGDGLLIPMGFEHGAREALHCSPGEPKTQRNKPLDMEEAVTAAIARCRDLAPFDGPLRLLSGPGAPVTALIRADGPDSRIAEAVRLILVNPSLHEDAPVAPEHFLPSAGGAFGPFERLDGRADPFAPLAPGEVRVLAGKRARPITAPIRAGKLSAKRAAAEPRLILGDVTPRVDGGPFPVKCLVGDRVAIEADIFADGHEQLAAVVQWRPVDRKGWSSAPMTPLGNDRWRAEIALHRLGRHEFAVEAWLDRFGTYRRDLGKKLEAGVAQGVDLDEGLALVSQAAAGKTGKWQSALRELLAALKGADDGDRARLLTSPDMAALMSAVDDRPHLVRQEPPQPLDAERTAARFSSWYELFPRSQTDDPSRHGGFDDVIGRLPAVRAMGFDTLYFPPIHPIGAKHRKGRNNSLTPAPDDPGSPYAIGSAEGGHDAIHPQLGTFEDFRRLVAAARGHGLEIALDFAIQCSPDHPWLAEHPDWFDWRPDGTIKYAENPPKKYQDIVNVDFYKAGAIPDLWLALRDIVLLWIREGVTVFRVDNPHTKPFAFWEWMIGEVRGAHPEAIFLAEAFTRPKVMYHLAKVGFSQSYTYFTWRHSKAEFIEYLTELTTTAPKDFFRPHFFVNTPDINPYFLQTSGRAGFLIRAALAATLSGLWGVYSGFELLESDPMPGKEEYKDSEKYEIKPRDWQAPGNIIAEITRLNRIRRGHPALQTHLGIRFHTATDDNILLYSKPSPDGGDLILTAVNLDPHNAHEADMELPLWTLGVADDGAVTVDDLISDQRSVWRGKWRRIRLTPDRPYAIWRLAPEDRA